MGERAFPQLSCWARVSASRLAASVPSGSTGSPLPRDGWYPEGPQGPCRARATCWESPPPDSPAHQSPQKLGRPKDLKRTVPSLLSQATRPLSKLSRRLLWVLLRVRDLVRADFTLYGLSPGKRAKLALEAGEYPASTGSSAVGQELPGLRRRQLCHTRKEASSRGHPSGKCPVSKGNHEIISLSCPLACAPLPHQGDQLQYH